MNIAFGQEVKRSKSLHIRTTAEYKGYTGIKKHDFPTNPHLSNTSFPDVTNDYNNFTRTVLEEVDATKKKSGIIGIMKSFSKKLGTGDIWDTKFNPLFPGRNIDGKTQYAIYKGKKVSANYLSNNLYGQAMTKAGFSIFSSKTIAKLYSCGIVRLLSKGKLPHKELLMFRDPPEDQDAIVSGCKQVKGKSPWINGIDPCRPYPETSIGNAVAKVKKAGSLFQAFKKILKNVT